MSGRRLWLALVLALFCAPLFVGLGREDVRDDEAIYSFAVDLILETGDWLEPKSIPNETFAFLEKPPLKFWIVAAPIRFGLLPHNAFGIRFWDALFGAVSFVYVFLIGTRLLNGVCGAIAVLVLFVHDPLLFTHGLRSNNMEAALVLSYCGGIYHYMAWASADRRRRGVGHAIAAGLWFVLGFMTKFVAVIFLPMVIAVVALLAPSHRRKLVAEWRVWASVTLLVAALVSPWFIWAWLTYGDFFWEAILGAAVYTRMTAYLDPAHVQPWSFYPLAIWDWLGRTGSRLLVVPGFVLLALQGVRRRWPDAALVVLWFALPIVLISFGTSKLYHYTYPFLPPLALGAGYIAALALLLGHIPLGRAIAALQARGSAAAPGAAAVLRRPAVRVALLGVAGLAVAIAVVSITYGPIRIASGSREVFKNSGVLRPLMVAVIFALLAGAGRGAAGVIVAVLVLSTLPLPAYRQALGRLTSGPFRMRATHECITRIQAANPGLPRGMYVDIPPEELPHPHTYYFRTVRPWTRTEAPAPDRLHPYLTDPAQQRPVLIWEPTYQKYRQAAKGQAPVIPLLVVPQIDDDVLVLLPGPYTQCGPELVATREP